MAGAPKGNNNGGRGKTWRDALDKAVKQYVDKEAGIERGQALFKIATGVVEQALMGNKDAITEIGNRLDGKPHQSMDIGVHEETPVEELSNAELAAELATTRELISRNTGKGSGKRKPH